MKKLFTLIAVALVAMSASAKEVIDFSPKFPYGESVTLGSWNWQGIILAQGEPVVDEEAKTADDSNVVYYDGSQWDYVVVKYQSATADVNLIVQYKCLGTSGQYGADFSQGQTTINASSEATYVALALDPDKKKTINQVALQPGNAASTFIIDEIYFATAEEWEAVKPAPAQTKSVFANVPGDANPDGTKTLTNNEAWHWFGIWLGSYDASYFDYLVLELAEPANFSVQATIQHNGGVADVSGQVAPGELILKLALDPVGKADIKQMALSNAAAGSFIVKDLYFATQQYIDNMPKPETSEIMLSGFNAWKDAQEQPRATFDPATGKVTVSGGEEGGGGSWWFGNKDMTDFDNFVLEVADVQGSGKVVVQYVAEEAAAPALAPMAAQATSTCEFGTGATCVVVPLNEAYKNAIAQVWVQGEDGTVFTMKKAYFAIASATPEANVGTGINALTINNDVNAPMYNLAGQRVDAQFKGVVIQNGRKFMKK